MSSKSEKPQTSYAFFNAVARIVAECLGDSHACTRLFSEARASSDSSQMDKAMQAVRTLPTAHRDHVLGTAKRLMSDDARFQQWVMKKIGSPTDIPPDRTNH